MSSVRACGLNHVQLALDPIREASECGGGAWSLESTRRTLVSAGISVISGMIGTAGEDYSTLDTIRVTGGLRPDKHWQQNLHNAKVSAAIAEALGLKLVTLHAGFVPHDVDDEEFHTIAARVAEVADVFWERGVSLALETGQEPAEILPAFLEHARGTGDPNGPGLNFDPANMILYGSGEPIAALSALAPHVRQVHIKDAVPCTVRGEWGTEVPAGTGSVDWPAFFKIIREQCPHASLVVEREAGTARVNDVRHAVDLIRASLRD